MDDGGEEDEACIIPAVFVYRKSRKLKVRRFARPESPFWASTMIFPYGGPRTAPLAIDLVELTATGVDRPEVDVAEDPSDLLSREQLPSRFSDPVVVESSGVAEVTFARGEEAARYQLAQGSRVMQIISTDGAAPHITHEQFLLTVAAWPFHLERLEILFRELRSSAARWGVWIPVIFPLTTDVDALAALGDLVASHGGSFLASSAIDLTPTAKSAIVRDAEESIDDEAYDLLFHSGTEPLALATERHIAALAHERDLMDRVPDGAGSGTNWGAASLLSSAGSRLARMKRDPEPGWALLRSAGIIASLGKPVSIVAQAAPLSIIEGLDSFSAEAIETWLRGGRPESLEKIDREWRLRRDAGM